MKKLIMVVLLAAALAVILLVRNELNIGIDDSDFDGWNRSGLTVHVDAQTGVNYFTTWWGGIVVRVNPDGTPYTTYSIHDLHEAEARCRAAMAPLCGSHPLWMGNF